MAISFDKKDLHYWGKWHQSPLSASLWLHWHKTQSIKELAPNHQFGSMLYLDGNFWILQPDLDFVDASLEEILNDDVSKYTQKIDAIFMRYENELLQLRESKLNGKEYVRDLFKRYIELAAIWSYAALAGNSLGSLYMRNGIVKNEEELLRKVSNVARSTWLEQQNQELGAIARQKRRDKDVNAEIDQFVEKYKWFGTHHWAGEGYSKEKALEELQRLLQKDEVNRPDKRVTESDPTIEFAAALLYWRTHCAEVAAKVVFESRPILIAHAKKSGLSYEQFLLLTSQEAVEPKEVNFEDRLKGYGVYLEKKGSEVVVTGEELSAALKKFLDVKIFSGDEIKGTVASRGGVVQGTAAVILSPHDFKKFEKDSILIAPETAPNFVPFMKMAKAVVTDVGGLTSHAGIVSRELGIPCITATKVGTQAIKNGDFIEVDSEKGIVKVLKRAAS